MAARVSPRGVHQLPLLRTPRRWRAELDAPCCMLRCAICFNNAPERADTGLFGRLALSRWVTSEVTARAAPSRLFSSVPGLRAPPSHTPFTIFLHSHCRVLSPLDQAARLLHNRSIEYEPLSDPRPSVLSLAGSLDQSRYRKLCVKLRATLDKNLVLSVHSLADLPP
jgi:hypothetical protein